MFTNLKKYCIYIGLHLSIYFAVNPKPQGLCIDETDWKCDLAIESEWLKCHQETKCLTLLYRKVYTLVAIKPRDVWVQERKLTWKGTWDFFKAKDKTQNSNMQDEASSNNGKFSMSMDRSASLKSRYLSLTKC